MKIRKTIATILLTIMLTASMTLGYVSVPINRMINSVQAYPPGTTTGMTLQNAYDYLTSSDRDAAMGTLGILNQRTLLLTAGDYSSTALILDTAFVNIVGLGDVTISDTSGAVIDCGSVECNITNIRLDASSIANGLTNDSSVNVSNVIIIDGTDKVIYTTGLSGTVVYDISDSGYSTNPPLIGATPIIMEGATVNAFQVTVAVTEPTADTTWTYPDGATDIFAYLGSTLVTNIAEAANSIWGVSNGLTFEGAIANDFETTIVPTEPTADRTITFPDVTGNALIGSAASVITAGATPTLTIGLSNVYTDTITTDNQDQTITFSGAGNSGDSIMIIFTTDTGGSADEVITFEPTLVSATATLTLANVTAKAYTIVFTSNGSKWYEVSRTVVHL